ncbi:MAG: hypothetical protein JO057_30580, partial [Chloroflexi bacterium]|nr:hypothetical protein [Chloroflexota bacterium]
MTAPVAALERQSDPTLGTQTRRPLPLPSPRSLRIVVLTVAAVSVSMAYVNQYPLVLGRWEDLTTFPMMFAKAGPRPSFQLYPSGDIAGDHYALLSLGYYTAELFGWSFGALRLPSVVAGLAAIATFFRLSARWYEFWPALIGALALAFNPTFFFFSHQLIVPIVSILFVALVVVFTVVLDTRNVQQLNLQL